MLSVEVRKLKTLKNVPNSKNLNLEYFLTTNRNRVTDHWKSGRILWKTQVWTSCVPGWTFILKTPQKFYNDHNIYYFVPNNQGIKLQVLGKKPSSSFDYYKRMTQKHLSPILRNLDNFPPGVFYSTPSPPPPPLPPAFPL